MTGSVWTDAVGCNEQAAVLPAAYALQGPATRYYGTGDVYNREQIYSNIAVANGKAYVFSGYNDYNANVPDTTLEIYASGGVGLGVFATTANPPARQKYQATGYDGKVYVCGGYTGTARGGTTACGLLHALDVTTGVWTALANCPSAKTPVRGGMSAYNGVLYVNAGADMLAYVIASDTWSVLTSSPVSAVDSNLVCWGNGKLVRFGGGDDTYVYDIATDTWTRLGGPTNHTSSTLSIPGGAIFQDVLYLPVLGGSAPYHKICFATYDLNTGVNGFDTAHPFDWDPYYATYGIAAMAATCTGIFVYFAGYESSLGNYTYSFVVLS